MRGSTFKVGYSGFLRPIALPGANHYFYSLTVDIEGLIASPYVWAGRRFVKFTLYIVINIYIENIW